MLTITLKNYPSKVFPVEAVYKSGTARASMVFANKEEAVGHLTGRFGKIRVIDKTR